MKSMFVCTYAGLGVFSFLLGLTSLLTIASTSYPLAWGIVGVLFLAIAATCLWLVCDCRAPRDHDHPLHA